MLSFNWSGKAARRPKKFAVNKTDGPLRPQLRDDGKPVTIRNFRDGECRWPYGMPSADMMMCGRPAKGPFCPDHKQIAYVKLKPTKRGLEGYGVTIADRTNTTKDQTDA